MPTLGFLKKKRTREATSDPSSTSNPTSPVTPAHNKTFESVNTAAGANQCATTLPHSVAHQPPPPPPSQSGPSPVTIRNDDKAVPAEKSPMNTQSVQHPYPAPQHTPSPGTDPQNLPSISNLINPAQNDAYQAQQLGSRFPVSTANGGIAQNNNMAQPQQPQQAQQQPELQQQLQQQQQLLQQQPPPQPQQHIHHQQQHHHQPGHHPVMIQTEPRVTKGKYSLADFEILRTLGTGSFGRVHLVQSRHNQRFYAVKVLKKAQVVKMKQVEHTNDERRMLGEVKHPFLITLWGTFQDSKNLYMVMDFVEGGELFSLLRKSGVRIASPPSGPESLFLRG